MFYRERPQIFTGEFQFHEKKTIFFFFLKMTSDDTWYIGFRLLEKKSKFDIVLKNEKVYILISLKLIFFEQLLSGPRNWKNDFKDCLRHIFRNVSDTLWDDDEPVFKMKPLWKWNCRRLTLKKEILLTGNSH